MKYDINEIIENTKKMFSSARGSHDWDHTERVLKLALHIGEKEGADKEILSIAAILHDIGRTEEENHGKICHAEQGALMAETLLREYDMDEENIKKIIHCIETHRFRGCKVPQSLEAKILYDADKLDSIGAIGLGRTFLFAGEIGAKVHNSKDTDIRNTAEYSKEDTAYREFIIKLRYIKDKIITKEGKKLAEERHKFMVDFFERLNREVDGEL